MLELDCFYLLWSYYSRVYDYIYICIYQYSIKKSPVKMKFIVSPLILYKHALSPLRTIPITARILPHRLHIIRYSLLFSTSWSAVKHRTRSKNCQPIIGYPAHCPFIIPKYKSGFPTHPFSLCFCVSENGEVEGSALPSASKGSFKT